MADIYVRPYGSHRKSPLGIFMWILVVLAVGAGIWLWWSNRPEKVPEEKTAAESNDAAVEAPAVPSKTSKTSESKPASGSSQAEWDLQRLFAQAQGLAADGKLLKARDLLGEVIAKTSDESLRNNALRIQGRLNVQLFLSDVPTPEKKPYVIQPGDSLDRIARRNDTTVELIRKMNNISGNLIYPGATIQLPAAPFVIHVHKSAKLLDLMMNGKLFKRYAVGLGRYGKTPLGTFHTVVHQENPDWTPPGGGIVPFGDPRNVLGTRWMSIQDEERPELQGFGIHGTSVRESIGEESSNGCVRMLNEDVEELFMLIPRGTEVIISE